jgi:DNA polymerase III delta subunit
MVEIKPADFKRLITEKTLSGTHMLIGTETYLKEEAVELAVQTIIDPANRSVDVLSVDAQEADLEGLTSFCLSPPFLGGRKIAYVREIGRARPAARKKWLALAARKNLQAILVFTTEQIKMNTSFLKEMARHCTVVKYSQLSERQLRLWARQRVEQRGASFTDDALDRLITMVGADLRALDNEIEKLSLLCLGAASIEEREVEFASKGTTAAYLNDLREAVLERKLPDALRAVQGALRSGESVPYIVASVYYLWRDLLKLAGSENGRQEVRNLPEWTYMGRLGRKKVDALSLYSRQHLWDGLLEFFAYDLAVKRGFIKAEQLLDDLVPTLIGEGIQKPGSAAM